MLMGSGYKKRKGVTMGDYTPTKLQREAMVWCINNEIRMWPKPQQKGPNPATWWVEIQIGRGTPNRSPEAYGPVEIWEKIYEYYMYYYTRNNK